MRQMTQLLWADQDRHPGDRHRLFTAVGATFPAATVLYPGSFVDVAASFVFDDVTYVDNDPRAAEFFADAAGVDEIIATHRDSVQPASWRFLPDDYRRRLDVDLESIDLLVSFYAGFVSEHCTEYLRTGGMFLVNPSHGDAAMASLDPRYELAGVVTSRAWDYAVSTEGLETYLIPVRNDEITLDTIRRSRRGVAYTRSPYAYLFRKHRASIWGEPPISHGGE